MADDDFSSLTKDAYEALRQVMMRDGKVSVQESILLARAMENIAKFKNVLEEALEDNVISEEEREQLQTIRHKIYGESFNIAMVDQIISEDEAAMLRKLMEIVSKFETFETT